MSIGGKLSFSRDTPFETRCDAMLLGRLGRELANVYQDSLSAPLPSKLHALMERLEIALETGEQTPHRPEPAADRSSR